MQYLTCTYDMSYVESPNEWTDRWFPLLPLDTLAHSPKHYHILYILPRLEILASMAEIYEIRAIFNMHRICASILVIMSFLFPQSLNHLDFFPPDLTIPNCRSKTRYSHHVLPKFDPAHLRQYSNTRRLLHRHRLGEISWEIHVETLTHSKPVGNEL